jgi:hypothetical protein
MTIATASKMIALSLCMSAWLFSGSAHAAGSHLYPAVGCQETYPDPDAIVARSNGALESDNEAYVTCPVVTDAHSTQVTVTVFYETALFAPATYAGRPLLFSCDLGGHNPAKQNYISDTKSVHPIVRNQHNVGGSLRLSIEASHQFNLLNCTLPGSTQPLYFRVLGYRVDES